MSWEHEGVVVTADTLRPGDTILRPFSGSDGDWDGGLVTAVLHLRDPEDACPDVYVVDILDLWDGTPCEWRLEPEETFEVLRCSCDPIGGGG